MTFLEQKFIDGREPLTIVEYQKLTNLLIAERDAWLTNALQFEKVGQKLQNEVTLLKAYEANVERLKLIAKSL